MLKHISQLVNTSELQKSMYLKLKTKDTEIKRLKQTKNVHSNIKIIYKKLIAGNV